MIKQAMVLCAGYGSRMGELTKEVPKPMIIVDGMSLIERHMHYLLKNNIRKLVINSFYHAEILEKYVTSLKIANEFELFFSREKELLGTAGGVKEALKFLGKDRFFIINNDSIFIDHNISAFRLLESKYNENISLLMLLVERDQSFGYWNKGDYDIGTDGSLHQKNEYRQYVNPGIYITDYRLFEKYQEKKLEFYPKVFKDLENSRSLYGCVYNGKWYHIGDLKAYELFNQQKISLNNQ